MNRFKSHRPLLKAVAVLATAFAATSAVAAPVVTVVDYANMGASNDAGINFALNYAANTPTGATWSDDPRFRRVTCFRSTSRRLTVMPIPQPPRTSR